MESFESGIKVREQTVAAAEKELAELRLKAESFPSELEKAVQTATNETTARLDKDYKFEKQLLLKDHEGEIKLKNQQIESLMAKIKDLELQLKQAYSKAENAENNSKEITLKAIQSSGQIKIIEKEEIRRKTEDKRKEFTIFLRTGGFPVLHVAGYNSETADRIVFDIYSSIILRDVVQSNNIRDVELLERVVRFVFNNIGNKFSARNVADYFKSQQRTIDLNTVYNYLNALEGAYIIYRVPRYDIKGKEILKTLEKYFVGDTSLVHSVMGYRDRIISGLLENIVMLELRRRNFRVFTGSSEEKEIDFIAEKVDKKIYVQVAFRMETQSTVDREFSPLLEIRDHYPKYVVTMDEIWHDNIEGIKHLHIADFLLTDEF